MRTITQFKAYSRFKKLTKAKIESEKSTCSLWSKAKPTTEAINYITQLTLLKNDL